MTNNSKVLFNVTDDEKLVEWVSKFPCLYDVASPLYKNLGVKDEAWMDVEKNVKRTVEDCKKRWRNIKDTYHKRKKKGKGTRTSSSSKKKDWLLADMLSFLGKAENKRQSTSNIEPNCAVYIKDEREDIAGMDESTSNSPQQIDVPSSSEKIISFIPKQTSVRPTNKRQNQDDEIFLQLMETRRIKRNQTLKDLSQNSDDATDLFFKSIAMSVKNLRPELINEAKLATLQIVFDLESRNEVFTPQHSPSERN